ncbi:transferase [Diaporthe helianthi]|uniref:Transferase n=1 Tax=Diaporthe helianthi TaxID=158607 RepID=A0A2P5IB34_DIAHE|nr:transferase [Diaporthe helianthi]
MSSIQPCSRVTSRERVFPATATPTGQATVTRLSIIDASVARFSTCAAVWLYNPAQASHDSTLHNNRLRQALRETLDDYRHLAGQLRWATADDIQPDDPNPRHVGRPVVSYGSPNTNTNTDPGVELVHAEYDRPLLGGDIVPGAEDRRNKTWVATGFPQDELLPRCRLAFNSSLAEFEGLPGVAVQITRVALARSLPMHRYDWWATDAPGYPAWATASSDATKPEPEDLLGMKLQLSPSTLPPWPTWDISAPVEHVQVRFSADEVARIKRAAQHAALANNHDDDDDDDDGQQETPTISRLDALLAHMWILINRARGHYAADETVYLDITLGLRTRVSPPLPESFVGSPILLGYVARRGKDVCSSSADAGDGAGLLGAIAVEIRRMMALFTPEAVGAYIHDAAHEVSPQRLWQAFLGKRHTLVTSWVRAGAYEVDFCGGEGGGTRPVYVQGKMPRMDGILQVMDVGEDTGDFDVSLCLEKGAMGRLLGDEMLRMYAREL